LTQFNPQNLEILEFSHFNKILLSLFDISNVFHDSLLANIEIEMCQTM